MNDPLGGVQTREQIRKGVFIRIQWGSEIRPSLDFQWSKTGWVANGLDFEWDLKFGSPAI